MLSVKLSHWLTTPLNKLTDDETYRIPEFKVNLRNNCQRKVSLTGNLMKNMPGVWKKKIQRMLKPA